MLHVEKIDAAVLDDILASLGGSDENQRMAEIEQMTAMQAFDRWLNWPGLAHGAEATAAALDSLRAAEQAEVPLALWHPAKPAEKLTADACAQAGVSHYVQPLHNGTTRVLVIYHDSLYAALPFNPNCIDAHLARSRDADKRYVSGFDAQGNRIPVTAEQQKELAQVWHFAERARMVGNMTGIDN